MARLEILITSFSFKKGLPEDSSEHGGGFVFDCRCLPNPGRQAEFSKMSGLDREVAEYIEALPESEEFFSAVKSLVDQAAANYISRGFSYLSVAFGCTGGQHRSVYFSEKLALSLRSNPAVSVNVQHRELPSLGLQRSSTP